MFSEIRISLKINISNDASCFDWLLCLCHFFHSFVLRNLIQSSVLISSNLLHDLSLSGHVTQIVLKLKTAVSLITPWCHVFGNDAFDFLQ